LVQKEGENLNQIYQNTYIREVLLKDGNVLKYQSTSNLKYGEPREEIKESSEWKELLKQQRYIPEFEGNKDRKGRIWCHVEFFDKHYDWKQAKVYKDDFVSIKIYNKVRTFKLNDFKMHYLVEQLNGEEFIRLLKDNEIKYIGSL
jgi:hypothetical protein